MRVPTLVLLLAACRHDGAAASVQMIDRNAATSLLTCPAGAVASGRLEGNTTEVRCIRGTTKDGPSLRIEPDHGVRIEGNFANGRPHGTWRLVRTTGEGWTRNYAHGELDGECRDPRTRGHYRDGLRHGTFRESVEVCHEGDETIGPAPGSLTREIECHEALVLTGEYLDGIRTGTWSVSGALRINFDAGVPTTIEGAAPREPDAAAPRIGWILDAKDGRAIAGASILVATVPPVATLSGPTGGFELPVAAQRDLVLVVIDAHGSARVSAGQMRHRDDGSVEIRYDARVGISAGCP